MSSIKIEFNTDNDSFKENGLSTEIYKIFADIQVQIALGYDEANIKDTNGNVVGSWSIQEK